MENAKNLFDLTGRVAVITGGTGLLGQQHAEAIARAGGIPVLADIRVNGVDPDSQGWKAHFGEQACAIQTDITHPQSVKRLLATVLEKFGRVDILVNNAANNPKMENKAEVEFSRLEFFPLEQWDADLNVGLKGAFLCSQVIGSEMARRGGGWIVKVASDVAVIAPAQRLYRKPGLPEDQHPVKPVTYSVVKTGLIGLTRYLATYWSACGIRVNAISPGGVYNNQADDFVEGLAHPVPL